MVHRVSNFVLSVFLGLNRKLIQQELLLVGVEEKLNFFLRVLDMAVMDDFMVQQYPVSIVIENPQAFVKQNVQCQVGDVQTRQLDVLELPMVIELFNNVLKELNLVDLASKDKLKHGLGVLLKGRVLFLQNLVLVV